MEENSKAEPELSEEQLGEITGGCRACVTDLGKITSAREGLAVDRGRLQQAQNDGNHEYARFYSREFDEQAGIITRAQERIVSRGHGDLLNRPQYGPLLPDLNQPPPR